MKYGYLFLFITILSCSNPIETALNSNDPAIEKVMSNLENHELQIMLTQIDSLENGSLKFKESKFQVDFKQYFYPASTVKLPVAIFATELISQNKSLSIDTPYKSKRDSLLHSLGKDIEQIFAVSDNEAYNRLYEMLGRDQINKRFRESGLKKSSIAHRLSTSNAGANKTLKTKFFPSYESDIYEILNAPDRPINTLSLKGIQKGKGFMKDGTLIKKPMDFSKKNYFPLEEQHQFIKQLVFPETVSKKNRFKLQEKNRVRILNAMKTLPRNAGYNATEYYDSYVKFFMYGDKKSPIPEHLEIYNKVGYAYGTLTETAYIKDIKNNIHFILSATILVNENGIFNDDNYEYETVGIPFLAALGNQIYQGELKR